jgi:hypothetical protein
MVDAWLKLASFFRRVSPDPQDEDDAVREAARLEESDRGYQERTRRRRA